MNQEPIDYRDLLDNPGNYKILRRITGKSVMQKNLSQLEGFNKDAADIKRFAILDFETTGFDAQVDQPIELGLVTVDYSPSQNTLRIVDTINMMEQPDKPIPEIVTQITGLTDEKVAGHRFDEKLLAAAIEPCDYLLAHNARFDRAFWDRRFPQYADELWGCTINDVPWQEQGFESNKLEYLLYKHGYFYDGHQALTDCLAVVQLFLDAPHLLAHLEKQINTQFFTVKAVGLPYGLKDEVKARGYRWLGSEKVWSKTCSETEMQLEQRFLNSLPGYSATEYSMVSGIPQNQRYA